MTGHELRDTNEFEPYFRFHEWIKLGVSFEAGEARENQMRSGAMHITFANHEDLDYLTKEDRHIGPEAIERKIDRLEILVLRRDNRRIGFLRFGYFWDKIPFMNLLWVKEGLRGEGAGARLVSFWESERREQGHGMVMTSSLSNERAQYFYRRLGYEDRGSLLMPGEPLEIVFIKKLSEIP